MPQLAEQLLAAAEAEGTAAVAGGRTDTAMHTSVGPTASAAATDGLNNHTSSGATAASKHSRQHSTVVESQASIRARLGPKPIESLSDGESNKADLGVSSPGGVAVYAQEARHTLDAMMRRAASPAAAASVGGWDDEMEAETVISVSTRGQLLPHHRLYVHTTPSSMQVATVVVPED